jgi:hypothetical protein
MALASNALTTVSAVKTYMGVTSSTDDDLIETMVNNVSDQIERWCDRSFVSQSFTEYLDAYGTRTIAVQNPPLVSVDLVAFGTQDAITVTSAVDSDIAATVAIEGDQARLYRVQEDGTETTTNLSFSTYKTTTTLASQIGSTAGFDATVVVNALSKNMHQMGGRDVTSTTAYLTIPDDAESEYRVDYDRGFIHLRADAFPRFNETRRNNRFPNQFQSVYVQYVGGYETIPNALVQAAFELISDAYRGRDRDRAINQESLGDYSYTLRPWAEWSENIKTLLGPFKRVR